MITGPAPNIDPARAPLTAATKGRVGKLRAYGNAIVPQVAAAFVEAYVRRTENPAREEG